MGLHVYVKFHPHNFLQSDGHFTQIIDQNIKRESQFRRVCIHKAFSKTTFNTNFLANDTEYETAWDRSKRDQRYWKEARGVPGEYEWVH